MALPQPGRRRGSPALALLPPLTSTSHREQLSAVPFLVPGGRRWTWAWKTCGRWRMHEAKRWLVPLEMRYTMGQTAANGYPGLPTIPSAVSSLTGTDLSALSLSEVEPKPTPTPTPTPHGTAR
ncbi:hypothetical protein CSOJ01_12898 [Colletotrichum sojae]|uniref:Uncharacterized protein n=1 Tax=Colletotrichum sojae TaxID=2175907 RepID=A0A8H6MLT5_9PEZI|nr:hypothetical protein CSOJ01_12898 [Colletotrichum sojae]